MRVLMFQMISSEGKVLEESAWLSHCQDARQADTDFLTHYWIEY